MFHINLRRMREDAGYTQKEFADMLSIRVTTYRNYENTLREPSYDILIKIAEILGTSTDALLGTEKTDNIYEEILVKAKRLSGENIKLLNDFADFLLKREG
ncbi:MAG: helix-turn-helix transcriptional regulator [Clostridia bacterium]|nr:helix-turn-helix transcriptional regulator [Clostridia bacterium]